MTARTPWRDYVLLAGGVWLAWGLLFQWAGPEALSPPGATFRRMAELVSSAQFWKHGAATGKPANQAHIETTLNNDTFGGQLGFLQRRENAWSPKDRAAYAGLERSVATLPRRRVREIFHNIAAPYQLTSVQAGETEAVHDSTLGNFHRQHLVPVQGQADVLVAGIPYLSPYNVNSILNPILVNCMALGYFFNLYRNKPLVREGGVMIAFHPVNYEWHPIHHPSYRPGKRPRHHPSNNEVLDRLTSPSPRRGPRCGTGPSSPRTA